MYRVCSPEQFVYESMLSRVYGCQWVIFRVLNDFSEFYQNSHFWPFGGHFKVKICPKSEIINKLWENFLGSKNNLTLKMGSLGVL